MIAGIQGCMAYNMDNGFSIGANLSDDGAFDRRVSADIILHSPQYLRWPLTLPMLRSFDLTRGVTSRVLVSLAPTNINYAIAKRVF